MLSPQFQKLAGCSHGRQVSGPWDSPPFLENAPSLLHTLNGERPRAKYIEKIRSKLHYGRKVSRLCPPDRMADVHSHLCARDKSRVVSCPHKLHAIRHAPWGKRRYPSIRVHRKGMR